MIKKARKFIEEVNIEMKKVTWPEREQLIQSTIVVLVISGLFTIFIFLADTIISKLMNIFY